MSDLSHLPKVTGWTSPRPKNTFKRKKNFPSPQASPGSSIVDVFEEVPIITYNNQFSLFDSDRVSSNLTPDNSCLLDILDPAQIEAQRM